MQRLKSLLLIISGLFSLILLILLASIPVARYERPNDLLPVSNSTPLVLQGIHVVDVLNGGVARNQNVFIRAGRIERISDKPIVAPSDAKIINVMGTYISPGLFDMHVHLHDRKYLVRNLAFGVTSVRNLRGLPMHIRWRGELERGEWLGSNLWTSSPVLDGEKYAHLLQQVTKSPEHARELVRLYKRLGYDSIKAYGYLDAEVFIAIVDEANALNIPVVKHGPNAIDGTDLIANSGLQSLEHVEDIFQGPLEFTFDRERLDEWLLELEQIDPYVTPTLATFEHLTLLSREKNQFVRSLELETLNPVYHFLLGEFSVKRWLAADEAQASWNERELKFLQEVVLAIDKAGIKLLVGSDAGTMYMPAGSSTHREIQLLSGAGLTNMAVLQAGTINAARALNVAEEYGSITEGKIADAIITAVNPLDDLSVLQQPLAVVKDGQWLSTAELDALKKSAENPSGIYVALGRLLEDLITRALLHP
jgi:hypothetical protein